MWNSAQSPSGPGLPLLTPGQSVGSSSLALLLGKKPASLAEDAAVANSSGSRAGESTQQQHGFDVVSAYNALGVTCILPARLGVDLPAYVVPTAQGLPTFENGGQGSVIGGGAVMKTYKVNDKAVRAVVLDDANVKTLCKHDATITDTAILPAVAGRELELLATSDVAGVVLVHGFELHAGPDRFAGRLVARVTCANETAQGHLPTFVKWHPGLRGQLLVGRGTCVWQVDLEACGVHEDLFQTGTASPDAALGTPAWATATVVNVNLSLVHPKITLSHGPLTDLDAISAELPILAVSAHGAPHHARAAGWDVGDMLVACLANGCTTLYLGAGAGDTVQEIGTVPARMEAVQGIRLLRCDTAGTAPARMTARFALVEAATNSVVLTSLRTDPATGTLIHGDAAFDDSSSHVLDTTSAWGGHQDGARVKLGTLPAGDCGAVLAVGTSMSKALLLCHAVPPATDDMHVWRGQWRWARVARVQLANAPTAVSIGPPFVEAFGPGPLKGPVDGHEAAAWSLATRSNCVELFTLYSNGVYTIRIPLHELLVGGKPVAASCQGSLAERDVAAPALQQQSSIVPAPLASPVPRPALLQVAIPTPVAVDSSPPASSPSGKGYESEGSATDAVARTKQNPIPHHSTIHSSPGAVRKPVSEVPAPVLLPIAAPLPAISPAAKRAVAPVVPANPTGTLVSTETLITAVSEQLKTSAWQMGIDAAQRQAKADADSKALLQAISTSLAKDLPASLTFSLSTATNSAVEEALARALGPLMGAMEGQHASLLLAVEEKTKAAFNEVAPQLTIASQIQPAIKTAMRQASQDMAAALKTSATEAFKVAFELTIVPAFERAVAAMIAQVNTRMESDAKAVQTSIQASAEQLAQAVSSMEAAAATTREAAASVSGASTSIHAKSADAADGASADITALRADVHRLGEDLRTLMQITQTALQRSPGVSMPLSLGLGYGGNQMYGQHMPSHQQGPQQQGPQQQVPQQQMPMQPAQPPQGSTQGSRQPAAMPVTPATALPIGLPPSSSDSGANTLLAAAMRGRQEGTSNALASLFGKGSAMAAIQSPVATPVSQGVFQGFPGVSVPHRPAVIAKLPVGVDQEGVGHLVHTGRAVEALKAALSSQQIDTLAFFIQLCASLSNRSVPGDALSPDTLMPQLTPFERLCILQRASLLCRPDSGSPPPSNEGELLARGAWLESVASVMVTSGDRTNEQVAKLWVQFASEAKIAAGALASAASKFPGVAADAQNCAHRVYQILSVA